MDRNWTQFKMSNIYEYELDESQFDQLCQENLIGVDEQTTEDYILKFEELCFVNGINSSVAETLQEEEEKNESVKEKTPESIMDEEQEKKEDKPDKSQAKDDDKPFFFASTDIRYRDKKEDTTQAQAVGDAESSKQEEI